MFFSTDCVVPLGIQSRKIAENRIKATSTFADYKPDYARLGEKSWCASKNDKHQYLQIDLGKVTKAYSIIFISYRS